jgi:hypothetical protein
MSQNNQHVTEQTEALDMNTTFHTLSKYRHHLPSSNKKIYEFSG